MVKKYFYYSYNSFNYPTLSHSRKIRKGRTILPTDVKGFQRDLCFESESFFFPLRHSCPIFSKWAVTFQSRYCVDDPRYILFSQLGYFMYPLTCKSISSVAKRIDMTLDLVYEVYWILNIYRITIICSFIQILELWRTTYVYDINWWLFTICIVNIFDSKNFKFRNISQSANIFENTIIKV